MFVAFNHNFDIVAKTKYRVYFVATSIGKLPRGLALLHWLVQSAQIQYDGLCKDIIWDKVIKNGINNFFASCFPQISAGLYFALFESHCRPSRMLKVQRLELKD